MKRKIIKESSWDKLNLAGKIIAVAAMIIFIVVYFFILFSK